MKFKSGDIFTRNNNYFILKHDKQGRYYLGLLLGHTRISSWHRVNLSKLNQDYIKVENYKPREYLKKSDI